MSYISKHSIMGMMSKNYTPFGNWKGFYKKKDRSKCTVFSFEDMKEECIENNIAYVDKHETLKPSFKSTEVVSTFNKEYFKLEGKENKEIRGTRNKWNKRIEIREEYKYQEMEDLINWWASTSGHKYHWQRHDGYDRSFFHRYWRPERSKLYSMFFYLEDKLVGYSIVSKEPQDSHYIYVIRKCDVTVGRNINLYIDYKMFEKIYNDVGDFRINWGASSGGVLKYKTSKFPVYSETLKYFYKVKK
jgi:hypothetical protein